MARISQEPGAEPGKLKIWLLAIRPKTLPAAMGPVLVGSALAAGDGIFRLLPALAALAVALLLQIGSNLANDVFDFQKGTDTETRVGPLRVTQAGLLRPAQVKGGMAVVFVLALLVGLYLTAVGGWPVLLVGVLAILSAVAYTGGPYPLGYHGLGEVFVFIFFGLVAVCGTYYVQAGSISPAAWWASLPVGFLISNILVVNNFRDLEEDRKGGKRTVAVRLGAAGTIWEYRFFLAASLLVPLILLASSQNGPWILLPVLSLGQMVRLDRDLRQKKGAALNGVLAQTAKLSLLFSLLYAMGYLLDRLL